MQSPRSVWTHLDFLICEILNFIPVITFSPPPPPPLKKKVTWKKMSKFVQNGGEFAKALALGSVQLYGPIRSASLYPTKSVPCLAAGLPHFSTQYMRCWGRDTFIGLNPLHLVHQDPVKTGFFCFFFSFKALRGLMMVTGRFDVAKQHICAFGSCMKYGLIPNLLDRFFLLHFQIPYNTNINPFSFPFFSDSSGRNPRYNCRDAAWWLLQAIQDYCVLSPEGLDFLNTKIERRYADDSAVR